MEAARKRVQKHLGHIAWSRLNILTREEAQKLVDEMGETRAFRLCTVTQQMALIDNVFKRLKEEGCAIEEIDRKTVDIALEWKYKQLMKPSHMKPSRSRSKDSSDTSTSTTLRTTPIITHSESPVPEKYATEPKMYDPVRQDYRPI